MDKINLVKKVILFLIGMAIIQVGVSLALVTDIGSDCFTVFNQGLSVVLNITPGVANMIILFCYLCIILFIDKKQIKIGTFICLLGIGPLIDLLITLLSNLNIDQSTLLIKCGVVVLGTFVIAVGFSILSSTNLGVAPNDIIPFLIKDKMNIEYKWVRMGLDFSYLGIGYLLGGTVGIGTIISAFLLGPFIQLCLPYGENLVSLFEQENNKEALGIDK